MKYILLLYCIYIWCIRLSASSHFTLNETIIEKNKMNAWKYIYLVATDTSADISRTNIYNNANSRFPESRTTPSLTKICNVTSLGNTSSRRNNRSILYFDNQSATIVAPDTTDFSVLSEEFLNCALTTVEPGCYQIFPNRSIYVPLYDIVFDRSNYVIKKNLLYVCPDFFDQLEEKFSSNIGTISIVGVSISTACIILHMIMFCLVEKLRNLPGYCLLSLCISLLIAYTNSFIQYKINDEADCNVIGMFMIYSLLSSFFWMNVISFDVWYAIRMATAKLRLNTDRSMLVRFSIYSCYAWGMPLLITIIAIIVDHVTEDIQYQLIFRKMTCWFQYRNALLLYFALPVFILLVMNIFFFITSFLMITRTRSDSGSQDAHNLRSRLFLSLRLGSAMGLVWIFGIIATITQREWIYYLSSLCTALQGVFIFFSFTLNKKTQKTCEKLIKSKKISTLSAQSQATKF